MAAVRGSCSYPRFTPVWVHRCYTARERTHPRSPPPCALHGQGTRTLPAVYHPRLHRLVTGPFYHRPGFCHTAACRYRPYYPLLLFDAVTVH